MAKLGISVVAGLCVVLLATGTAAALGQGDAAPAIDLGAWLNAPDGEAPTPKSLEGRVVMVEFWGTWCGPCVRSMPRVQELHDRYGKRGLVVLAISYETPEQMRAFLAERSYTMPVGSDPEKKVVSAFGVRGWPSTFVVDKEGRIAYAGSPYGVEPAIEAALGLESSPGALLTAYVAALGGDDEAARRDALERLVEKAPADFDLRAWAAAAGGGEAGEKPDPSRLDAGDCLDEHVKAVAKAQEKKATQRLEELAKNGPDRFDLASWARRAFGRAFPIRRQEMVALLEAGSFRKAIDAMLDRGPDRGALAAAVKHDGLAAFAGKQSAEARKLARKGVMILRWVLAGRSPKDNDAFWRDLSVSGVSTSENRTKVVGVLVAGDSLTEPMLPAWIDRQLARALVMEEMASGDVPRLSRIPAEIDQARTRIEKELERRYANE